METVEPLSFLIVMALIVATWIIIGIRDRRAWRREAEAWRTAIARNQRYRMRRWCAHTWWDKRAADYGVCTRRDYEHDGPHFDGITGYLHR